MIAAGPHALELPRDRPGAASSGALRSYYGRPILKPPVWQAYVPLYFFCGGLAGASAGLAFGAAAAGNRRLARNATFVGMAALAASPPLLILDLGRPARFYNMFRVMKPTSPMSVGTWILTGAGAALMAAATGELLGALPRPTLIAHGIAAFLGLPLATYTAALVSDTAVPAWHDAHRELPFVFAGSAAASAGGLAAAVTPGDAARPARWLAVGGAAMEVAAATAMERNLGPLLSEPYRRGRAGLAARAARIASTAGATALVAGGGRRVSDVLGGSLVAMGALLERFAVAEAGVASARDSKYVVLPQRERVRRRAEESSRAGS